MLIFLKLWLYYKFIHEKYSHHVYGVEIKTLQIATILKPFIFWFIMGNPEWFKTSLIQFRASSLPKQEYIEKILLLVKIIIMYTFKLQTHLHHITYLNDPPQYLKLLSIWNQLIWMAQYEKEALVHKWSFLRYACFQILQIPLYFFAIFVYLKLFFDLLRNS